MVLVFMARRSRRREEEDDDADGVLWCCGSTVCVFTLTCMYFVIIFVPYSIHILVDLLLAAELGKTLLERNKDLESQLQQSAQIQHDQTKEIDVSKHITRNVSNM